MRSTCTADRTARLALAVGLGALYAATVLPGIGYSGDTAKFGYLGPTLGTGHPPGNPGYLLVSFAFSRLVPIGGYALRVNLLSAAAAVATVLVLHAALRRAGVRPLAATVTAAVFGVTPLFWTHAVIAEVYTLLTLAVAGVLYATVRWLRSGQRWWLAGAVAIAGIAVGVHVSIVLLAPALLLLVLRRDARALLDPRVLGTAVLAGAAGLGQYAYLAWRTADPTTPYVETRVYEWDGLWWALTASKYQHAMFGADVGARLPDLATGIGREWLILVPVAVYGAVVLGRRAANLALAVATVTIAAYATGYLVPDWAVFLLPASLLATVWVAFGTDALLARIPTRAALGVAAAVPLLFAGVNLDLAGQHDETRMQRAVERVLATVGDGAAIYAPYYRWTQSLLYYRFAEGVDVAVIPTWRADDDDLVAYVERGRPIFIAEQRLHVEPGRPLFVLRDEHAWALRRRGLAVEKVATIPGEDEVVEVFRVTADGAGQPPMAAATSDGRFWSRT